MRHLSTADNAASSSVTQGSWLGHEIVNQWLQQLPQSAFRHGAMHGRDAARSRRTGHPRDRLCLANIFSPAEMVGGRDHLASSCITPSAMTWINKDPRRPEPFALSS
jgi:hypothetical protein